LDPIGTRQEALERRGSLGDTAVSGAAGPALVELLPRVLHDSPAAMLLVDLNRSEVTYANRQAVLMAPGLGLPVKINDWSQAAGLRDPDGVPLPDTGSPLSRIASGQPVAGESVTAARDSGAVPAREPLWVTGFPLTDAPGLSDRALVVFFRLADASAGSRAVEDVLSGLRDRAVLATDVSFTISDPGLPDNPLVWVNPAFTRITGYSFEDAAGRNSRFLQGPATDRETVRAMRDALATHQSITVTLLNYRKDGTAFWNEVSVSPVFDGDGRLTNFVGVQADVTARVQAEAEREEAYRATERAQSRLTVLAGVSAALSTTLDVGEALHRMAAELVPAFADWCAVDLAEPHVVRRVAVAHKDPGRVAALSAVPPTAGVRGTVVSTVLAAGQPQLFAEIDDARLAELAGPPERLALLREVGVTSGLVVPLRARSRVLGALSLGLTETDRRYGEEDLSMVVDIGRRAGLAVDNAQLFGREHEVAVALQRSMLPRVPSVAGLEISAHYFAGSERADVGGDWYDVLPLPDGSVGVAVGDVMGHDLIAAAAMGQLRSVLRSYAWEGHRPSEVLERLDRLVQGLGMAQLATCVYGRLLPVEGGALLRYANAGHLPPVVQRRTGEVEVLDGGKSVLIGAPGGSSEGGRPDGSAFIPRGATLILYTDGLVEDRETDVDAGVARLCALVAGHDPALGVSRLCDRLLDELLTGPRTDDAAVIAVRISDSWGHDPAPEQVR
jgi:PAS domain S-box-containing protein